MGRDRYDRLSLGFHIRQFPFISLMLGRGFSFPGCRFYLGLEEKLDLPKWLLDRVIAERNYKGSAVKQSKCSGSIIR